MSKLQKYLEAVKKSSIKIPNDIMKYIVTARSKGPKLEDEDLIQELVKKFGISEKQGLDYLLQIEENY